MQNSTFTPWGPTYYVGPTTPVQVLTTNGQNATSYRVRNTTASQAWFAWDSPTTSGNAPLGAAAVAPVQGSPSNVIGMNAASVETFNLGANIWFIGSAAATFEVTPGEGM